MRRESTRFRKFNGAFFEVVEIERSGGDFALPIEFFKTNQNIENDLPEVRGFLVERLGDEQFEVVANGFERRPHGHGHTRQIDFLRLDGLAEIFEAVKIARQRVGKAEEFLAMGICRGVRSPARHRALPSAAWRT